MLEIVKTPLILSLNISKNVDLFNLLDNYSNDIALISNKSRIINWISKERNNYIIGEIVSKRNIFDFGFYFVKSDFKSYNINYFDKIEVKSMREDSLVIGFLINNKTKLKTYNILFDSLIIDNYFGIINRNV